MKVPESRLRFGHAVLPAHVAKFKAFVGIQLDGEQGSCGRGLVVTEAVQAGTLLFEEPPLVVVSAWGDPNDPDIAKRHQAERWLAYSALVEGAAQGGDGGVCAKALAAFDELSCDAEVPEDVHTGARYACSREGLPTDATYERRVVEALMRFKCNQFGFQEDGSAAFAGAALYASISRMNHSCRPSAVMAYKESVCKVNQMPFNVATDGGVRVAISARDLQPGERLTFSYYAPCSDPAMAVEERRAVLMHRYGFRCGCERCDAEGEAVVAAAGEAAAPEVATEEEVKLTQKAPEQSPPHVQQSTNEHADEAAAKVARPATDASWLTMTLALATACAALAAVVVLATAPRGRVKVASAV